MWLLEPAGYGVFVLSDPLAGSVERVHVLVDDVEHDRTHVFAAPVEVVQEAEDVLRAVLSEVGRQDRVDAFRLTEHTFGIFEVLQVVSSPHPVGAPAGDDDPLFPAVSAVQGCCHGCIRTVEERQVVQAVHIHGVVAGCHQAGTRVDTDDLTVELTGDVVDLGDAVNSDVGGYCPADVGTVEVRTQVNELITVLVPVRFVRGRQPGGNDRIEVTLGQTGPHRAGVNRGEFNVVTELVHQDGGNDVRRGDLGVP